MIGDARFAAAAAIARTVLYEGYVLYPYTASAPKNRGRISFGGLVPASSRAAEVEPSAQRVELLCEVGPGATVSLGLAFLEPRGDAGARTLFVEADERCGATEPLDVETLLATPAELRVVSARVTALARLSATRVARGVVRLRVDVRNDSPPDGATMHAAHTALSVANAALVSAIDPPAALAALSGDCVSEGAYPILAGKPGDRSVALASPIILYDHPRVAPESVGDTFDATENDALLLHAILALPDAERAELAATDPRAAALLERLERLPPDEAFALAAGTARSVRAGDRVRVGTRFVGVGDRVRLRPKGRKDVLDLALAGRDAVVASIETDVADRVYFTVVLDDDPGRALGLDQRGLGHRFFLDTDEVEPIIGDGPREPPS